MNKKIPLTLSICLVLGIFLFFLSLDNILYAPDGLNHYKYSKMTDCGSGYANGICVLTQWTNLSEFGFWFLFFIISLLIPVLLVWYTKNLWLFLLFFVFTGFFWQSMAMQVFAQIIVSLVFVFFVFESNRKFRWVVLGLLFLIYFVGIELHNSILFVMLAVLLYEVLSFVNLKKFGWLGCGVLPSESVKVVSKSANSFREPMNNNVGNLFQNLVYYSYSFFWENMFVGFLIPAVYQIFKDRDLRKFYYLLFVVGGALFLWGFSGFKIWWVTRVLLWLPIILLIPFLDWLNNQTNKTKFLFCFMGLVYFVLNVYYFVNRVQDMACG